jgi:hypothetical protein
VAFITQREETKTSKGRRSFQLTTNRINHLEKFLLKRIIWAKMGDSRMREMKKVLMMFATSTSLILK